MKIEVGKTYKNAHGARYFIEAKLTHPVKPGYQFYGSGLDTKGFNWYNENGESSAQMTVKDNLLPNTVKKEGWTNLYRRRNGVNSGYAVHDTEDKARRHNKNKGYVATVRVEWEEEV